MTNKLFVGSLSWNATEQMLQDLFATVGTVQSVHILPYIELFYLTGIITATYPEVVYFRMLFAS